MNRLDLDKLEQRFLPIYIALISVLLALAGCASQHGGEIGCEVQPVEPGWDRRVAPAWYPRRVEAFAGALRDSSEDIDVVDAGLLWHTVFNERDPAAGVNISEFRHSDIAIRTAALGIRHIVVLDTGKPAGEPVMSILLDDVQESPAGGAVMITFTGATCDMERYLARAEGRETPGWVYLDYHFEEGADPAALRAVTGKMAQLMDEQAPERPVKVIVLAAGG